MKTEELIRGARALSHKHSVTNGEGFRLDRCDPQECGSVDGVTKDGARELLEEGIAVMAELQSKLYAQDHWAILLIFQAMDAAGKDGVIKQVMSGINPQGCEVHSFKAPSSEEIDHDYMWRAMRRAPPRGTIGIFNRSYYEEVLVVRVHPEILKNQKLPAQLVTKDIFDQRYTDIRRYERFLSRNGTVIRKFFLNVSKKEQRKRFLERIDDAEKHWKFSAADVRERQHWDAYMAAYEKMIQETSSPEAPWHVIPADNKWYTRLAVASVIIDTLSGLDLHYPTVDAKRIAELHDARAQLMAEKD